MVRTIVTKQTRVTFVGATVSCINQFAEWSQLFVIPLNGGLLQIYSQSTKAVSKQNKAFRQALHYFCIEA